MTDEDYYGYNKKFSLPPKKVWDKVIKIYGRGLEVFISYDGIECDQDRTVTRNVKKMIRILNKHWDDKND